MAKVTIKVKDGEVTIPVLSKVVKDGKVIRLYRVHGEGSDAYITYIYPQSCGKGDCQADGFRVEELAKAKPCSVDFWNATIYKMAFEEMTKINKYVLGSTINE